MTPVILVEIMILHVYTKTYTLMGVVRIPYLTKHTLYTYTFISIKKAHDDIIIA
jgi:hypothetical protein